MNTIDLAERGWLSDGLIRFGIRRMLRQRVREDAALSRSEVADRSRNFAEKLRNCPLAVSTDAANEQHYEVPADFFKAVLGPRLKYSSCLFEDSGATLAEAEESMLRLTCTRAELADHQSILELGCGWGSLTLWMAEHFPHSQIVAISNSNGQRRYIERQCALRQLKNVRVVTADMRDFNADGTFDRIVSVEMFEHLQNYELLFRRISGWLNTDGKLFAHIFCRRHLPYLFETEGAKNWMGRHFFTGGVMPEEDLFSHFNSDLKIDQQWRICGEHYAQTCEQWLVNLDRRQQEVMNLFTCDVGLKAARLAFQRWRMFFMACAELFRFSQGNEWYVAHYLFSPVTENATVQMRGEATTV